jgi:site-specific recombinase XerD
VTDDFALLRDSFRRDLRLRNKAERTIGAYIESCDRFIGWARAHGLTSVTEVTREHIGLWIEELLDTVSAQTTVRHHSGAKQWFKWLLAEDEVEANPFDGVPQPAVPEKLTEVPSVDDVRAVLKACSGKTFEDRRDYALIMVLADGGPRAAETVGLRVDDVDLNEGVLIVMAKERRPRGIPIGHKTIAALDRYLRARAKHDSAARHDALWLGARGPLTDSGIRQILISRSDQAGVRRLHPHALRHFFADSWLRAGGTESDLMRMTGWKSRQMVDRYAAALGASRAREAHKRLSPGDRL